MPRSAWPIRAYITAALILSALLLPGVARAQTYINPAPSPTGMLYGGAGVEMRPNGQWGLADYPTVSRVDSGSVSARAGFQVGDVLLSVNGRDVRDARPFRLAPGEVHWVVRIRRGTEEKELTMELPPSMQSASPSRTLPRR
jgi:S1-C subfamily serine protease